METWTLKGAKRIGFGESRVYKNGDRVVKVFCGFSHTADSFSHLRKYKALIERAIAYIEKNPIEGTVTIEGVGYSYSFRIVPILDVGIANASPATICEYIPGMSLNSLRTLDTPGTLEGNPIEELNSVTDRKKKRRLGELSKLLVVGSLFQQFLQILGDASKFLARELDVKGIWIEPLNVKVDIDAEKNDITFIVTDVCAEISSLNL